MNEILFPRTRSAIQKALGVCWPTNGTLVADPHAFLAFLFFEAAKRDDPNVPCTGALERIREVGGNVTLGQVLSDSYPLIATVLEKAHADLCVVSLDRYRDSVTSALYALFDLTGEFLVLKAMNIFKDEIITPDTQLRYNAFNRVQMSFSMLPPPYLVPKSDLQMAVNAAHYELIKETVAKHLAKWGGQIEDSLRRNPLGVTMGHSVLRSDDNGDAFSILLQGTHDCLRDLLNPDDLIPVTNARAVWIDSHGCVRLL